MKSTLTVTFLIILLGNVLHCGMILEKVYSPDMIMVGDSYLYIAEGWEIKIFSRRTGEWIRSFGRRGEGPGEFNGYIIPYLTDDGIMVNCPARILYFDREGRFLRERRALKSFGRLKPMGKNFVGYSYLTENRVRYETVRLFDAGFHPIRELYRRKYIRQADGSTDLVNERPPFFYIFRGKIYLDGIDGYIHVFNQRGEPIERILGVDEKIPLTRRHINEMIEDLKRDKRTRDYYFANKEKFVWPRYQPLIRMFYMADGRFYILTSRERNGKNEMVIRNLAGKLMGKTFVAINSFPQALLSGIRRGRLVQLIENEDGDWELRETDLIDPSV